MPVALAAILRQLLMALITGAAISAVQQLFSETMQTIVSDLRNGTGISEQDAKDLLANWLLDTATNTGVTFALLKVKMPAKVADYLGFTTKGFNKRTLSVAAQAAEKKAPQVIGTTLFTGTLRKVVGIAVGVTSLGWLVNGFFQIIEPGIYQPEQTNAIYRKLGIPFQYPTTPGSLQPGPYDKDSFKDLYNSLEAAGIVGIEDPEKRQTLLYSREALAGLVEYVYGKQVQNGSAPLARQLTPLLQQYLRFKGAAPRSTTGGGTTGGATSSASVASYTPDASSRPLAGAPALSGSGASNASALASLTTAYIDDATELQAQAAAALRAFITSLGGDLVVEIKTVSRYTDDEGATHYGGVATVQDGVTNDGKPKLRKYTGQFAILEIFYDVPGPGRKKLISIPLGSVNVAAYRPTANDLALVASSVSSGAAQQVANALQGQTVAAPAKTAILPQPTVAAGVYQVEKSQTPEGYEVIYYPPGTTPDPTLRYPGAPEPSKDKPAFIPTQATQAQLEARLNPQAVVVSLPLEGTVYRAVGDDVRGVVYQIVQGVPTTISSPVLVANTDLRFPNGIVWRAGTAKPQGENERDSLVVDPNFRGLNWSNRYDREMWDATHGSGAWERLPAFNRADIETVMALSGGKLPNTATFTLNSR